ncbi:hypothetical protein V8E54_002288 [Elaphomyces granulatus]
MTIPQGAVLLSLRSLLVPLFLGEDQAELVASPLYYISTTSTVAPSASVNAATNVAADVSTEPAILQEGGDEFVDIDDILFDEALEELDLSGVQRAVPPVTPDSTAIATAATTLRRLLRRQLRLNHENEAAQRAQRTESSGRGGQRLLVVLQRL